MDQKQQDRTDSANGQDERDDAAADRGQTIEQHHVSTWEWAVAALGLILVVGTIGFMLFRALTETGTPPTIEFSVGEIQPSGPGYLVTFTATNRGNEAAADLLVEGQLAGDDGSTETSSATLAYLPGGSHRQGGLFFVSDPRARPLVIRAKGYERP